MGSSFARTIRGCSPAKFTLKIWPLFLAKARLHSIPACAINAADMAHASTQTLAPTGLLGAGRARAINKDIDRCGEAVKHAKRPRIHTFVSTSPIHLAHQMKKTQEEVLDIISATVSRARNLVDNVEWSAMDATRTPLDYLCR